LQKSCNFANTPVFATFDGYCDGGGMFVQSERFKLSPYGTAGIVLANRKRTLKKIGYKL